MNRTRRYDVVVIGAGTAGLVAATRLAQGGASVCVVAKGIGSTHLAPGTIDVLGYAPLAGGGASLPVNSPTEVITSLVQSRPDHPYALIGADAVPDSIAWLKGTVAAGPLPGYQYVGEPDRNLLLPTAIGALKPSALLPETMVAGDASDGTLGRVCLVGLSGLRDFYAKLCAANLRESGIDASAVTLELTLDRADINTRVIAQRMDEQTWRREFCSRLSPLVSGCDRIGLPAILGLRDPHGVHADMQQRLGRPIFEIPTLPPSAPGMRLYEVLRWTLAGACGQLVLGGGVVSHEREAGRLVSVTTASAGHDTTFSADWFVLATGGVHSGAITVDSAWTAHESVLGLPLSGAPAAGQARFNAGYFSEQPLARVGVALGADLRAEGTNNVFVAGASLPGAESWREGSGEGIALASGYRAAEVIAASVGATAGARA